MAYIRSFKVRVGRPFASERILFGKSKIAVKNFQTLDFFLQGIPSAPLRSLRVRGWRHVASEMNLFWNSKFAIRNVQVLDFFVTDFLGAHKEL